MTTCDHVSSGPVTTAPVYIAILNNTILWQLNIKLWCRFKLGSYRVWVIAVFTLPKKSKCKLSTTCYWFIPCYLICSCLRRRVYCGWRTGIMSYLSALENHCLIPRRGAVKLKRESRSFTTVQPLHVTASPQEKRVYYGVVDHGVVDSCMEKVFTLLFWMLTR